MVDCLFLYLMILTYLWGVIDLILLFFFLDLRGIIDFLWVLGSLGSDLWIRFTWRNIKVRIFTLVLP